MIRVCIAVLLFHTMSETRETHLAEGKGAYIWSRYLRDKLQFGTRWKAYIPAMTYDLLHSSIHRERSSDTRAQESLLNMIGNFPSILSERRPCRRGTFVVYGRQFCEKFFIEHTTQLADFLTADYRICGVYDFTYNPSYYIDESSPSLSERNLPCPGGKPLRISWNLQAGEGFGINFTLSEFSSHSGCADARVVIIGETMVPVKLCPTFGQWNFISRHLTVTFVLHYYQNALFMNKRYQNYTKCSFYYQVLDFRNMLVLEETSQPRRQIVQLGMERTLKLEHFNVTFLNVSNPDFFYILILPYASGYSFAITIGGFLTPVIYRKNFTCNIFQAEAIFYDGPVQTLLQPALPILKYWNCSHTNTTTNHDDEEVRGSIGELNIIFFVPKIDGNDFSHLEITWQAQRMLPSAFRIREVVLNFSESTTIDFRLATATLVDIVHVQAPGTKFIQFSFTDIYYVASSKADSNVYFHRCVDGFEIRSYYIKGSICSNSTAENLLNNYKTDGLVVGQNATLIRKQYGWLLPMSAVIIARSHSCVGYINVFPSRKNVYTWYKMPQAIVSFDIAYDFFWK